MFLKKTYFCPVINKHIWNILSYWKKWTMDNGSVNVSRYQRP